MLRHTHLPFHVVSLLAATILLAIETPGRAQDPRGMFTSHGIELQSWIPREALANDTALIKGLWGYTSPQGREYAIIAHTLGTSFVEVTDPNNATIMGFIDAADTDWREAITLDHYVYLVGEAPPAIQVVDLSEIDDGILTLVREVHEGGSEETHTITINPESEFLYRNAGGNTAVYGLRIYDITVRDDPIFVAEWNERYVHDSTVVTYTEGPYAGREIAFCFNEDTVAGGNAGLDVLDVTDKQDIIVLSSYVYPKSGYAHQGVLSDDWSYIYINDESDELDFDIPSTTHVLDVTDLKNPVQVTTFSGGTASTDHNMTRLGRFIFQSNYTSGLQVFDSTDPIRPVQVGFFDTHPEDNNVGLIGAFANYPFFPSGTVVGTDREYGFFVWDATALADCDSNGLDDAAEIAADAALDSDRNRILDACQDVLHVPADYATVQEAIDAAGLGDMILLADGTYSGEGNRNLTFNGKVLTLQSENGAENCILDGGGETRLMNFNIGESFGTIISGLTITNGSAESGAGIHCFNAGPVIRDCIIIGNAASSIGGGIYCENSSPVIENCLITLNTAGSAGGGVYSRDESRPALSNCTLTGNEAGSTGGAVYAITSSPIVADSILWGNTASNGPEIGVLLASVTVSYTDLQGGVDAIYNLGGDVFAGDGIIDADPQWVGGPLGDFYLSQTAAGQATDSPCVDSGSSSASDRFLDNHTTRTDETTDTDQVDMGYHYAVAGDALPCDGDANGDGTVDPLDSGFVLARFGCDVGGGDPNCDTADMNGDGQVDPLDVGFVLARFGPCR